MNGNLSSVILHFSNGTESINEMSILLFLFASPTTIFRAVNADLFRAADLSFSVENLPRNQSNQSLASVPTASTSLFSGIDAAFNSSMIGLHAALSLGDIGDILVSGHHV